jgi:hypothetical protein
MSSAAASEIAANAAALRAELKEWERGFAAANGGRKAGRNDIKQIPEIGMSILPTAGFKNVKIQLMILNHSRKIQRILATEGRRISC